MSTSSVFVSILSNQFLRLALNWSMDFFSIISILRDSLAWDMRWISREFAAVCVCVCADETRMRWRFMYSGRKIAHFQIHIFSFSSSFSGFIQSLIITTFFFCVIESIRNCVTVHIPFHTRNHQHWRMQVISKFIWSIFGSVLFAEFSNFIRIRWQITTQTRYAYKNI